MVRLGQHFLYDETLSQRMAQRIPKGAKTLEIGGGKGALTKSLLQKTDSLVVYEVDKSLCRELRHKFYGKITLVNSDFRDAKFSLYDVIASSVPFYISLDLALKLYEEPGWKLGLFILQSEFVDKLTARPGSRAYRRVSVLAQYAWNVKVVEEVPRSSFHPRPRVDAKLIEVSPKPDLPTSLGGILKRVVDDVFRFPNKTLINAIRLSFTGEAAEKVLNLLADDILSKRVRNTDVSTFAQISKIVNV